MSLLNANATCIPLADQSVHCVVTSPPYFGLRDYGVGGQLGLEPFVGSGTTVIAALNLGRRGIGLDLSLGYLKIAQERTRLDFAPIAAPATDDLGPLFAEMEADT